MNSAAEYELASAWQAAVRQANPAAQAPTSGPESSREVLALLLASLAEPHTAQQTGERHGEVYGSLPALQRGSAFQSFPAQQQEQQAEAQPRQNPDAFTKQLEALAFWSQLYQVAHSGLRSALQNAQAHMPTLPPQLAGLATLPLSGAAMPPRGAPVAQLQALLQASLQGAHPQPQELELQQQQVLLPLRQPDSAAAGARAGFHAERSIERLQAAAVAQQAAAVPQQQSQQQQGGSLGSDRRLEAAMRGLAAERSLDPPRPPVGFGAERSLDRQHPQHLPAVAAAALLVSALPAPQLQLQPAPPLLLPQPQPPPSSGAFGAERSLERGGGPDPDSVVGFGKDWSLDPSDQSQEQRKRARKGGGEEGKVCSNCGTSSTPFWRKDRYSGLALCNACGLYASKNDHPRPVKLWGPGGPPMGVGPSSLAARSAGGGESTPKEPKMSSGDALPAAVEQMLNTQQYVAAAVEARQAQQAQQAVAAAWGGVEQLVRAASQVAQQNEHQHQQRGEEGGRHGQQEQRAEGAVAALAQSLMAVGQPHSEPAASPQAGGPLAAEPLASILHSQPQQQQLQQSEPKMYCQAPPQPHPQQQQGDAGVAARVGAGQGQEGARPGTGQHSSSASDTAAVLAAAITVTAAAAMQAQQSEGPGQCKEDGGGEGPMDTQQ